MTYETKNDIITAFKNMLDNRKIKYKDCKDHLSITYTKNEVNYRVVIKQNDGIVSILADMPFLLSSGMIPVITLNICKKNERLIFAKYRYHVKIGKIVLEYSFIHKQDMQIPPEDILWTYYYSVYHIAGEDIEELKALIDSINKGSEHKKDHRIGNTMEDQEINELIGLFAD